MASYNDIAFAAESLRQALKRELEDSDDDCSIELVTNRGNKLYKKARFMHEGQLAPSSYSRIYQRNITYGDGEYTRNILSRNPPIYGSDDELIDINPQEIDNYPDAKAAKAEAYELYPYADIRIEELLAPLTAASDLSNHATLSQPFTSKTLTELTRNACGMMHKERASLWKMKHLLTRLSGDRDWNPCDRMETGDDIALFQNSKTEYIQSLLRNTGATSDNVDLASSRSDMREEKSETAGTNDVSRVDSMKEASITETPAEKEGLLEDIAMLNTHEDAAADEHRVDINADTSSTIILDNITVADGETDSTNTKNGLQEGAPESVDPGAEVEPGKPTHGEMVEDSSTTADNSSIPPPRRMRTRAQAQAASDLGSNSVSRPGTPAGSAPQVSPYFLIPACAVPAPDIGLPPNEAQETRRLLQAYVQKQEEVCRGMNRIYDGLLRAERLRNTVLKWCKAEAHVGEMSDGEDWYDREEWGLTEDLKKGQDEEEEDAVVTAKKTRTRRQ